MKLLFDEKFPDRCKILGGKPTGFEAKIDANRKKTTIREDKRNRWEEGQLIEMITGGKCFRTSRVKMIQKITIGKIRIPAEQGMRQRMYRVVQVDGKIVEKHDLIQLAKNDGFATVGDFFDYFDADFKGKLIHWEKPERL